MSEGKDLVVLVADLDAEKTLQALLNRPQSLGIQIKPDDPKAALEATLRKVNKPRSAAIYAEMAGKVSLQRCTDPSFSRLKRLLRGWFGP